MFIEKCDIQNLSSGGAACETQKQHAAFPAIGHRVFPFNLQQLSHE